MIRKLAWRLLQSSMPAINRILSRLELALSFGSDRPLPHVPVFIIGAPRSGSTLLFQVLTEALDFGYMSNLHCLFHGAPSWLERLVRPLRWRTVSTFASTRGVVTGWSAPSECGGFWYRFFRRDPQYVPAADFGPRQKKEVRAALRALVSAFGRPVLFKNMHCALRLGPLALAVPEALFIFIKRDVVETAHSLLETRREVYADYSRWWSMEPPQIDSLKNLPPEQQVVEQVRTINSLVEHELESLHRGRFLTIAYEDLSACPASVIDTVSAFLDAHHARPAVRESAQVPEAFGTRRAIRIDPDLYDRLCEYAGAEGAR